MITNEDLTAICHSIIDAGKTGYTFVGNSKSFDNEITAVRGHLEADVWNLRFLLLEEEKRLGEKVASPMPWSRITDQWTTASWLLVKDLLVALYGTFEDLPPLMYHEHPMVALTVKYRLQTGR